MMFSPSMTGILKAISLNQVSKLVRLHFHCTPALSVKELVVTQDGNSKVIEGMIKESSRANVLVKTKNDKHACPVCRLNMEIKHTDVLILSQFVRKDGCMLPRRVTGLCALSQKRMSSLVSMAHIAGLMPSLVPAYSKPNCQKRRRDWKKNNIYFDEATIRFPDPFYKDKNGVKGKHYEKLGVQWEKEPWKNRYQVDVNTQKAHDY